jgi:hypothetical protein
MSIYVNGVENTMTYSGTGDPVTFSSSGATIGQHYNTSWLYSSAITDDVRMYSRELTAADVTALYAAGAHICSDPTGHAGEMIYNEDENALQYCNGANWLSIGPKSALTDGLVGHWKLDETSGATITDSSGNSLDGSWTDGDDNDVTGETTTGSISSALTFDGTDDYISIPDDSNAMDVAMPVTISAWVYPTSFTSHSPIFASDAGTTGYSGYLLSISTTGAISVQYASGGSTGYFRRTGTGTTSLTLNQWNHVTGIIRGATDMSIYINGTKDSISYSGTGGDVSFTSSTGHIGHIYTYNRYANGGIDDVRFYDRELSAFEVKSLHAMGASCEEPDSTDLVGYWPLDETSGSTIADASGNGIDGTWSDSDDADVSGETETGMVGNALHFDGTDDYINIPYNAALDLTDDQGTVMGWMKSDVDNIGQNRVWGIFRKQTYTNPASDPSYHLGLRQGASSDPMYAFNRSMNVSYVSSLTPIEANQWYHVVASWDNDHVYLYLNGQLEISSPKSTTMVYAENARSTIGYGSNNTGGKYADGLIDEVRVYDKTLTPLEIASLYGATGGACTIAACSNPFGMKGELTYNADYNVMQYCNGGFWVAMGPAGDGGSACSNPTGYAGTLRYDGDNDVLMYCEGDKWMGVAAYKPSTATSPPPDPCDAANNPVAGTVCLDTTIYAGISPDGNIAMYTTPADQSSGAYWGVAYTSVGTTSSTDGDGNSEDTYAHVMAGDGSANPNDGKTPNAFVLCHDLTYGGYSDWYLPARDELSVLYTNNAAIGGFDTSGEIYWTSTQVSANTSRVIDFSDGSIPTEGKYYGTTSVRCVRTGATLTASSPSFSFSDLTDQLASTEVTSDIVEVTGLTASEVISISGDGSPEYRICSDSSCSTVHQDWRTSDGTIDEGQYIQLRLTSSSTITETYTATLTIDSTAQTWSVTTVDDPCDAANSPTAGTVCADSTIYVDGTIFTTPSDQSSAAYWGTLSYTTGATSYTDGQTNSATAYADVIAGNGTYNPDDGYEPNAFVICNDLTFGGHSDWYLPARDQLSTLYTNRVAIGNFDTSGTYYWSSTETNSMTAHDQKFNSSFQNQNGKTGAYAVRCVRQ